MAIRFDASKELILGMITDIIIGCDFVESNSACILTERSIFTYDQRACRQPSKS